MGSSSPSAQPISDSDDDDVAAGVPADLPLATPIPSTGFEQLVPPAAFYHRQQLGVCESAGSSDCYSCPLDTDGGNRDGDGSGRYSDASRHGEEHLDGEDGDDAGQSDYNSALSDAEFENDADSNGHSESDASRSDGDDSV